MFNKAVNCFIHHEWLMSFLYVAVVLNHTLFLFFCRSLCMDAEDEMETYSRWWNIKPHFKLINVPVFIKICAKYVGESYEEEKTVFLRFSWIIFLDLFQKFSWPDNMRAKYLARAGKVLVPCFFYGIYGNTIITHIIFEERINAPAWL